MITGLTHLSLFVHDQDEALNFYTKKLGFEVHTDVLMPNGERWLTIHPEGQKEFEIALMYADTTEQKAVVGKQAPLVPFFCVSTDDCKREVELFKKNGVKILSEPEEMPWGIGATLADLYGNSIYMVQAN